MRKAKLNFISKVEALKKRAIVNFRSVVSSLPKSDDTLKYLNKAAKWSSKVGKALGVLEVFGGFFDAISIGVNAWAFDSARKDGNDAGMASAGLSMAAGKFDSQTAIYSSSLNLIGFLIGCYKLNNETTRPSFLLVSNQRGGAEFSIAYWKRG